MTFSRPKKRPYSEDELYEYALGALARRMRTVAELKRLFRARVEDAESEYGQTLIELVIRRLKDRGYLNDSQYAAYFSSLRRDNQKFGRMRVVTDLKVKGATGARISAAEAHSETERSKGDDARFPSTGPRRVWHQNNLHHPEELEGGRRDSERVGERNCLTVELTWQEACR